MKQINFNLSLQYIQNIRFCLALREAGFKVSIPKEWESVFLYLGKYFKEANEIKYYSSNESFTGINFNHEEPSIWIGDIKKGILFPPSMLKYVKGEWSNNRSGINFQGLMTPQRKRTIQKWLNSNRININMYSFIPYIFKLFSFSNKKDHSFKLNDIKITVSTKGREFPVKAWDEEYMSHLLNSKFIICPNGDYIWTYRFFEAIMCGAIPIVEDFCDLYEGFKFYYLSDNVDDLVYTEGIVNYNYKLLTERTTFSEDEIIKLREVVNGY